MHLRSARLGADETQTSPRHRRQEIASADVPMERDCSVPAATSLRCPVALLLVGIVMADVVFVPEQPQHPVEVALLRLEVAQHPLEEAAKATVI